MKVTQKDRIINYIREFGSITDFEATRDLGILQFGTRLHELKKDGYEFRSKWETRKNKYGEEVSFKRYYLADMITENLEHVTQYERTSL